MNAVMKYRLIRNLWKCPMPVGAEGECVIVHGAAFYRFKCTLPNKYHVPDTRSWRIPEWICQCMPHYFKKVRCRPNVPVEARRSRGTADGA